MYSHPLSSHLLRMAKVDGSRSLFKGPSTVLMRRILWVDELSSKSFLFASFLYFTLLSSISSLPPFLIWSLLPFFFFPSFLSIHLFFVLFFLFPFLLSFPSSFFPVPFLTFLLSSFPHLIFSSFILLFLSSFPHPFFLSFFPPFIFSFLSFCLFSFLSFYFLNQAFKIILKSIIYSFFMLQKKLSVLSTTISCHGP